MLVHILLAVVILIGIYATVRRLVHADRFSRLARKRAEKFDFYQSEDYFARRESRDS